MKEGRNVVNVDRYDQHSFELVKQELTDLQELESQGKEKLLLFGGLLEDVYGMCYKYDPKIVDEPASYLEAHKDIISEMIETKEYKELREYTRLKDFESAIAVNSFGRSILKRLPQDLKKKMEDMEKAVQSGASQNKIDALAQEVSQAMVENEGAVRRATRVAIKEAMQDTQEAQAYVSSFGTQKGQEVQLPMQEKVKMVRRIQNDFKLKKIAEMAGRFQNLAIYYQKNKVKHGMDEIVDITLGNNPGLIVPSELACYDDPDLEEDFLRRFSQGQVLNYKMEGVDNQAKGPIIVCIDDSGSMSGQRELWAKAFSLGILTIAKKQKRDFAIVHFGGVDQYKTFLFKAKKNGVDLLEALSLFFNAGGTDFQTALEQALKILSDPTYKKADIVFVTDGECTVNEVFHKRFKKAKEEKGFKVLGILINTPADRLPFDHDLCVRFMDGQKDDKLIETLYGTL